jgi:ribosomal protein L18E
MKKGKSKAKRLSGINSKLLQKGGKKNRKDLPKVETEAEKATASKKSMSNAVKMAKIERYAKENKITIAQAMVHFMK